MKPELIQRQKGGGVFHAQDSGETREDGTVTPPIEGNVAHTQVGETREFVVYNGDVIQVLFL
jgi:hypothetical protein